MSCTFCIVAFVDAGTAVTGALDQLEQRLAGVADAPVQRTVDTGSVAVFELGVRLALGDRASRTVPVAVTVYKDHGRGRIQVLTHDVAPDDLTHLEDLVAEAMDARLVSRSRPALDLDSS